MKTELEVGVTLLQAKESQKQVGAGKGKVGSLPEPSEGAWPCQNLDFRHLPPEL